MTPENPLLAPRLLWQIALAVTLVLVAIRGLIWLRDRKRAAGRTTEFGADDDE
jgi:hypothetical protein